jgi:hypothetical protein
MDIAALAHRPASLFINGAFQAAKPFCDGTHKRIGFEAP